MTGRSAQHAEPPIIDSTRERPGDDEFRGEMAPAAVVGRVGLCRTVPRSFCDECRFATDIVGSDAGVPRRVDERNFSLYAALGARRLDFAKYRAVISRHLPIPDDDTPDAI